MKLRSMSPAAQEMWHALIHTQITLSPMTSGGIRIHQVGEFIGQIAPNADFTRWTAMDSGYRNIGTEFLIQANAIAAVITAHDMPPETDDMAHLPACETGA